MSLENLENNEFKTLMQDHILTLIEYMFNANQEFGVACEIKDISFEPNLPEELHSSLPEITLFMLANYSFDSATIDSTQLVFEAGFGPDNLGAMVTIPLLAIKQLFVGEYPVMMNIASIQDESEPIEEIDSMSALLNNPENAKLFKKSKP